MQGEQRVGGLIGIAEYGSVEDSLALNPEVDGNDTIGKVIGTKNSGHSANNLYALNRMSGQGHDNYIQGSVTIEQVLSKMLYLFNVNFAFGDLGEEPIWGIDEGKTLPYLLNNPDKTKFNPDSGTWEPVPSKPNETENPASYVSVTFHWLPIKDAVSYIVERNGEKIGEVQAPTASFTDTKAELGQTYRYKAIPVFANGEKGEPIEFDEIELTEDLVEGEEPTFDLGPAPQPPLPVEKPSVGGGGGVSHEQVPIQWEKGEGEVDDYIIIRDGEEYDRVPGTETEYVDKNPTPGKEHEYVVVPENEHGRGEASPPLKVEVPRIPAEEPKDMEVGKDFINIEWYAIDGAAYYEVHHNGQKVHTQQEDGSEFYRYEAKDLDASKKHSFAVIPFAEDGTQIGDPIEWEDIELLPSIDVDVLVNNNDVKVTWTKDDRAQEYHVAIKDKAGKVIDEKTVTGQEATFSVTEAGKYEAHVSPIVNGKQEGAVKKPFTIAGETDEGDIEVEAVANLRAEEVTAEHVKLTWSHDGEGAEYIVKRNGKEIARVMDKHFTDNKVSPSTTYTYEVIAVQEGQESEPASVKVKTEDLKQEPVVTPIKDQETVRGQNVAIDLNNHFTAVDGKSLTYTVTIKDQSVAKHSLQNGVLTLVPETVGSTVVEITADDGDGGKVTTSFKLTVANQAPVGQDFEDMELYEGDPAVTIDVSKYFTDPEGDKLTFEAKSNRNVASVELKGTELKVTAEQRGTATITVTATDEHGGKTSKTFQVKVLADNVSRPANLKGEADDKGITLTWDEVERAVEYIIKRDGVEVARVTEPTFLDEQAEPNSSYRYAVSAVSQSGKVSAEASIRVDSIKVEEPQPEPEQPAEDTLRIRVEGTTAYLDWDAVEGADRYRIETEIKDEKGNWKRYKLPVNANGTSHEYKNLPADAEIKFVVTPRVKMVYQTDLAMTGIAVIKDGAGNEDNPKDGAKNPVQNVKAVYENGKIIVTWDEHSIGDDTAVKYRIQRYKKDESGQFVKDLMMEQVEGTRFVDERELEEGGVYRFEVIPFYDRYLMDLVGTDEVTVGELPKGEETATVEDPDTLVPAYILSTDKGIHIQLQEQEDLTGFRIQRYVKNAQGIYVRDGSRRTISNETSFLDTTVKEGQEYRYEITLRIGSRYAQEDIIIDLPAYEGKPAITFAGLEGYDTYTIQRLELKNGELVKAGEPFTVDDTTFEDDKLDIEKLLSSEFSYQINGKKK